MVARTDTQAFFALPPNAICPKAPERILMDQASPCASLTSQLTNHEEYDYISQGGDSESVYDDSDEDENNIDSAECLDGFSGRGSMPERETHRPKPNRTLWPRPDSVRGLVRNVYLPYGFTCTYTADKSNDETESEPEQLVAKNRQLRVRRSQIEMQNGSICAQDQHLQTVQTDLVTLRSQLNTESQRTKQLLGQVKTQGALLALQERALGEIKADNAIRVKALDTAITGLGTNQLRLEQSIIETDRLQTLLESIHEEHRLGAHGPMHWERFENTIQQLQQQSKHLTAILKQSKKEVRDVLGMVLRDASDVKPSRSAAKRKRIKEEQSDNEDDGALRACPSAVKMAGADRINMDLQRSKSQSGRS